MRLKRTVVVVGCFLSVAGCSDDSGGDDGSNGEEQGIDWSTVNPPPNIDVTSCYDITYETDDQFLMECPECCDAAGYDASSSLNDNHCTCGAAPDDDRDTVCAAAADATSSASCEECCGAAGYSGYGWIGGSTGASCECNGKSDSMICAAALDHPTPDESCFYCCLQSGFLSAGYVNFGEEECTCISL